MAAEMDRSEAVTSTSSAFVTWEEVYLSSDKGRREVHYYLRRRDGTSDLAVVGKEKRVRHMSYHYAIRSISSSSCLLKLRSRREVIDWLNSIVTDSPIYQSSHPVGGSLDGKDPENLKEVLIQKLGQHTTELLWLGSPWTCRKRRRHYQSFLRNGVRISVHDFVYVLAEEDKRLVAYLDDMYEDSRSNKMVVVRWFHRIDEVGIVLPQNYNDREIFFSLCLQDLSIECIDGLATVLSPQHYEKFLNESTHTQLEPFVCHRQFDNDDVKPFDVTQVKGYWKQELIRFMFTFSPSKASMKSSPTSDGLKVEGNLNDGLGIRPRKRLRRLKGRDQYLHFDRKQESLDACLEKKILGDALNGSKIGSELSNVKDSLAASMSGKGASLRKSPEHLTVGSQVEVLSQDSGIRGCWFQALIIKKHKDKVKVQYQDILDAADEAKKLEEWVLASKVAIFDEWGVRACGRPIVRPIPPSNKGKVSWVVNVGTFVDVWWNDAWWEGIVVRKEIEDRFCVYFPGEKKESSFSRGDLRHAQEWMGNQWKHVKERPELVTSILTGLKTKRITVKFRYGNRDQSKTLATIVHKDSLPIKDEAEADPLEASVVVRDLSKDELLAQLRWKSSRKRKCSANSSQNRHSSGNETSSSSEALDCERFFFPKSLNVDNDNCKYIRDSLFSSSVVPSLTNLVMSR